MRIEQAGHCYPSASLGLFHRKCIPQSNRFWASFGAIISMERSMRNVIIVCIILVAVYTVWWMKRLIPYSPWSRWVLVLARRGCWSSSHTSAPLTEYDRTYYVRWVEGMRQNVCGEGRNGSHEINRGAEYRQLMEDRAWWDEFYWSCHPHR